MANWEVTKTKRYNKPIEEHTANTKGGAYKIEVPEGSRSGVLYRFDDLRGFERIASGDIASLKQQAESMGKKESRGVAGIERLANMSRPGAKAKFATSEELFRKLRLIYAYIDNEANDISEKQVNDWKKIVDAAMSSGDENIKRLAKRVKDAVGFSRPGAKAKFKVEDRFYFGKGRKERFADDAKQIADTILKQLGGGRFIAMTGAKNLAFSSSPPGLRMSIGRGAKDAIKYLRVDYDRGSDTYTMIFANKSGGTVKSVSHVYADSLQRVFTSTTGFDTHL